MTTRLDKPLRRELMIGREPWVITLTPAALKLTRKGHRKGLELEWEALIGGDAALAVALNASARAATSARATEENPRTEPHPRKAQRRAPNRSVRGARSSRA
jgi:hypothetical protein